MDHLTLDVIRDRHTKEVMLKLELHFCTAFFTVREVSELLFQLHNKLTEMYEAQPEPQGKTYCPSISTSKER